MNNNDIFKQDSQKETGERKLFANKGANIALIAAGIVLVVLIVVSFFI